MAVKHISQKPSSVSDVNLQGSEVGRDGRWGGQHQATQKDAFHEFHRASRKRSRDLKKACLLRLPHDALDLIP